jgi:hypothetical protein
LYRSAGNRALRTLLGQAQAPGQPPVVQRIALAAYDDGKPMHDPSRVSDAEIEATDEYKAYLAMNPVPIPMRPVEPAEARLACRLYLRFLRQSPTPEVVTRQVLDHWLAVARSRGDVTGMAESAAGSENWVAVSPNDVNSPATADSDFLKWMLAGGQEPNPRTGKMNCWEMALFAAYRSGNVSEKRLRSLYDRAKNAMASSGDQMEFPRELERSLRTSSEQIYDPTDRNSPRPLRGDLVIFTEAAEHVALATGNLRGGQVEVMSLWAPPNGNPHSEITTVEALLAFMQMQTAKFWSPIW